MGVRAREDWQSEPQTRQYIVAACRNAWPSNRYCLLAPLLALLSRRCARCIAQVAHGPRFLHCDLRSPIPRPPLCARRTSLQSQSRLTAAAAIAASAQRCCTAYPSVSALPCLCARLARPTKRLQPGFSSLTLVLNVPPALRLAGSPPCLAHLPPLATLTAHTSPVALFARPALVSGPRLRAAAVSSIPHRVRACSKPPIHCLLRSALRYSRTSPGLTGPPRYRHRPL